ncbi:MAG: hypothetical protein PHN72_06190 [Bacilli bacterium]|nr:hypothetical protein [Bacilli bacterium]
MKKVLIATRNLDKLEIVTKLLSTSILEGTKFYSLRDIEGIIDKKEVGDVTNRAKEKALNVFNNMKQNDFDYIIGIDDVIKIKGKISENIKDYLKPILFEQYLEENEIISIVRAFTFIDQSGHMENTITEIPYEYQPLKETLDLQENSYPLNHVMANIDTKKTVAEMTKEEGNIYYLKYSKEPLEYLIKGFIKEEVI